MGQHGPGRGERVVTARADAYQIVGGNYDIARAGDDKRIILRNHGQQRLQPAQHAVGAPLLGEFRRRAYYVALVILQNPLEALQQSKCVGRCARKTHDDLSVQVHPPDEYARVHENGELGKTEAWYIVEAQPGSRLIRGLKPGTTREEFRSLLDAGTLEKCLHGFEVRGGDVIFLSAGTIHAIGKGIVLAEMQQNSDTTYRVYDWNRVGLDGKPRELHVEKALDVIDFDASPNEGVSHVGESERQTIMDCKYFTTEAITLAGNSVTESVSPERFEILCAVEGAGKIMWSGGEMDIVAGTSLLLPAAMGDYTVSSGKRLRILRTLPGQNPG